ncbi:MAG: phage terminase small subunit P27 family [Chloroflexi bacterium]|nr:phage terminase small subunit P27 family [Chloroflexota bacterium]
MAGPKGGWRGPGGGARTVVIAGASGVAPVGLPPAPSWLSDVAKLEYRRIARELVAAGIATRLDATIVAAHADAVGRLREATLAIKESAPLMRGRDGVPAISPWVRLQRDAFGDVMRTSVELGLTPASRGRVKVADSSPGAASSPIARLLAARAAGQAGDWWDVDVERAPKVVREDGSTG